MDSQATAPHAPIIGHHSLTEAELDLINHVKAKGVELIELFEEVAITAQNKGNNRHDPRYIAQQLQKIDPLYVYSQSGTHEGYQNFLCVSQNDLISDLIASMQTLKRDNDESHKLLVARSYFHI